MPDARQVNVVQDHVGKADGYGLVGVLTPPKGLGLELLNLCRAGILTQHVLVGFNEESAHAATGVLDLAS